MFSGAGGVARHSAHRCAWAGLNGNKHAIVPTRQGLLTAAAGVDAFSAAAAADIAREAARPTTADDTARGTVKSGPAATPPVIALRLYTCGQGMGAAGTSDSRPGVLDPRQGFPLWIKLNTCHH